MAGHGHEPAHGHHGDIGEDYNIGTIVTVGVVGCLIMVLTIVWLRALYVRAERWEWERKVVGAPVTELVDMHNEQRTKLNSYDWSDPAGGFVTLPVADVQPEVLARLQAEQARESRPAATTPVVAAQAPAAQPSTENAATEAATPETDAASAPESNKVSPTGEQAESDNHS